MRKYRKTWILTFGGQYLEKVPWNPIPKTAQNDSGDQALENRKKIFIEYSREIGATVLLKKLKNMQIFSIY